jgi:hypothetical protein
MEMSSLYSLVRSAVTADTCGKHLADTYVQRHARDAGINERQVWDDLRIGARRTGDDVVEVLATRRLRRPLLGGLPQQAAGLVRVYRRSA